MLHMPSFAYLALASTLAAAASLYTAVAVRDIDPLACAVGGATITGATGAASWALDRLADDAP